MDEGELLLSCLYVNPPKGVPRKKIDAAFSDYKVARERGEKTTFGEMLVRRGILRKGEPEKLLAAEKAVYGTSSVKAQTPQAKRVASTPKPVKAAAAPSKKNW